MPVIASINATSAGAWTSYARLLADAGADALELNLYHVAADPARSGRDVEEGDAALVMQISSSVGIPVAVKISPYYSSLSHTACSFADAGAAGLVCFNRFYQPDLDPDTREVMPCVDLSEPWELRLPLRWIAILRPLLPEVSLAATTGISTGRDVAKALLVGADVAMMTSALLRHGPEHVARSNWSSKRGPPSTSTNRSPNSGAASATPRQTIQRRSNGRTTCTSSSRTRPRARSGHDSHLRPRSIHGRSADRRHCRLCRADGHASRAWPVC